MRILVGFAGGMGHVLPIAPIARAALGQGHDVVVAGRPQHAAQVRALGLEAEPVGTDADVPASRTRLRRPNVRVEERVMREGFARVIARERAAALLELAERWGPDVVMCDETDFGAIVAAERLGLPHAQVLVLAAGSLARRPVVAAPLAELRAAYGLPDDPELAMLDRDVVVSPFPPSLRDPAYPLPATALAIRPSPAELDLTPPAWLDSVRRPLVYVTLGTVFNLESGDLFERALAGLGGLDVDVVATVGPALDPASIGEVAANVRLEAYMPQDAILPRCSLVVCHGGSGSLAGALAHGVPSIVLPMGADQPANASRVAALGVGRVLDALDVTPEEIAAAARAALDDGELRTAAGRVAAEIAALPGPEAVVPRLEELGRR